jgi:hypothetical protein
MRVDAKQMLDSALADPAVNRTRNDYEYRSGWSGTVMGQQFRLDVREAKRLAVRVAVMPRALARAVLAELHARASGVPATLGSVSLTENAALELTKLAGRLGSALEFGHEQPRPAHPVG